eukprot:scaffold748_cov251-Pinguiococcus_pyrenoidosus.AAC.17
MLVTGRESLARIEDKVRFCHDPPPTKMDRILTRPASLSSQMQRGRSSRTLTIAEHALKPSTLRFYFSPREASCFLLPTF